jgi:hypothetical protein
MSRGENDIKKNPQQRVWEDVGYTYLAKLNNSTNNTCYMSLQNRLENTH